MRIGAHRSTLARTALLAGVLLFGAGCGDDDAPPRPDGDAEGSPSAVSINRRPSGCEPRSVRECKVILPTHEGVESCFVGLQLCESGGWGECVDAEAVEEQLARLDAVSG